MTGTEPGPEVAPRKRADARRNEETLLAAAAAAFVVSGVDVPVRDIAARAGVGVGTVYRHFPTRADLIVAVYRHQVEACADAGPALLRESTSPTPPSASGSTCSSTSWSPSTALPARCSPTPRLSRHCTPTSSTASSPCAPSCSRPPPGRARSSRTSGRSELMRGVGNLCIGADTDPDYDARRMVKLVIAGLRQ